MRYSTQCVAFVENVREEAGGRGFEGDSRPPWKRRDCRREAVHRTRRAAREEMRPAHAQFKRSNTEIDRPEAQLTASCFNSTAGNRRLPYLRGFHGMVRMSKTTNTMRQNTIKNAFLSLRRRGLWACAASVPTSTRFWTVHRTYFPISDNSFEVRVES